MRLQISDFGLQIEVLQSICNPQINLQFNLKSAI